MKLRFPLSLQQLLFAAGCSLLLGSAAMGQDAIILKTGQQQVGNVLGVTPSGAVELQLAGGTNKFAIPMANIQEVRKAPPPELALAMQQFQNKEFSKALVGVKPVVDKFRGLPTTWAQQATSLLGDIYIGLDDLAKAEAAYNDFKKYYPSAGSLQSEVGLSRLAVAKKDYATAKGKLEPITTAALQEKIVNPVNALAYSQAFLVSGQVKEAEGNLQGALEDYLRTVTLFYHDRTAVASAQERANALRAAHKEVTVP